LDCAGAVAGVSVAGFGPGCGETLKLSEAKVDSRWPELAATSGTNVSDMSNFRSVYKLADLTFNNTVTRRFISLDGSVLGIETVAP
jgi:hypothetical protein